MATALDARSPAPAFDRMLHIHEPEEMQVGTRWIVFLDDHAWWARYRSDNGMIQGLVGLLPAILAGERVHDPRVHLLASDGAKPMGSPRWTVRITASLAEDRPEWALELQDESAWRIEDYSLEVCLTKLVERLRVVTSRPRLVPANEKLQTGAEFERSLEQNVARLEELIVAERKTIAAHEADLKKLLREQRAIAGALTAYRQLVKRTPRAGRRRAS